MEVQNSSTVETLLESPLQISPRSDANGRVMYGLDAACVSLLLKQDYFLLHSNVTTSAETLGLSHVWAQAL